MINDPAVPGRRPGLTLALGLLPMLAVPLQAGAETAVAVSMGAEYRTGNYGLEGDDVDDIYVPVTVDVQTGKLVFRATVPYVRVEGPEGSVRFSDTLLPGDGPTVSESGIGDVIASVTLMDAVTNAAGDLALDLTGTVKLGVADEDKGLGTGETDFSAQADLYRFLDGATVFASLGYKVRGEPSGVDLKDTWFASAGGAVQVSARTTLGASLGYRPEVVSSGDPSSEVTVYLSRALTGRVQVRGFALVGLADASPDWGGGLTLRLRM